MALRDMVTHEPSPTDGITAFVARGRPQIHETDGAPWLAETPGQHLADRVTTIVGSWPFIATQSVLLLLWIAINSVAWQRRWDPYPFILLNLVLSFQAAFTAPIILMSQNRQTTMDRLKAEDDYAVDRQADQVIADVHARLDDLTGPQWAALLQIQHQQLELLQRMEALTQDIKLAAVRHDECPSAMTSNQQVSFSAASELTDDHGAAG